jgi:hypothetical protein
LAVDLGQKVDYGNANGEQHVKGSSIVLTAGTSTRNFKLADAARLSFDALEEVKTVSVLFDRKVHLFEVRWETWGVASCVALPWLN